MNKPKIIEFAEYYPDGGTQYVVRADMGARCIGSETDGLVEFDHIGDPVSFPLEKIDWLIECLNYIKDNVDLPDVPSDGGSNE